MAGLKRTAETQLTRDHVDDDDDVMEIAPSDGFKRADKSILASRPMKGLPKRTNPTATKVDVPSSNNFDFGPTTKTFGVTSSPFTFGTSTPTSESANTQPSTSDSPFKFSSPAVSSTASSAAKQLAGMISSASQPNGIHIPSSLEKPSASIQSDAELKYYATLRGLNKSLIVQIARTFEQDSYYDFTVFLDQYREFRADIDREFKESQELEGATLRNGISSPSSSSSKTASIPAQKSTTLSMPTPPKAFAGFGTPSSTSGSSTSTPTGPAAGGFKPNFSAMHSSSVSPSLFTFNSSGASEEKNNSIVSGSSGSDAKSSPSGTSADRPKPFPFGAASSTSSPFGSTSTSGLEKPATPFGSGSGFGVTSSLGRSSTFSGSTGGPSNIFGNSGAGSSTLLPAFGSSGSSAGGLSFGGVKTASASFGGSSSSLFGSKPPSEDSKGSDEATTGEPVASSSKSTTSFGSTSGSSGFSFGSSSATTASSSKDVFSTSAKSSASPASVASGVETRSSTPASGEAGEAAAEETAPQKVLGENPNDVEGEGEEDEETLFTTRGKIYRFGKKDDKPAWIEVGVGMIRIKKKKTDASIRLLSRNTSNGKIMMNFKLYTGFKISQTKSILNFVGHDESGSSVTYRVRVKDEAGATEFHEAIESAADSLEA